MPAFRDRHLAIIDTETTGLDPSKHCLLEIGVIRVTQNLDVVDEYSAMLMPTEQQLQDASAVALKVNQWDPDEWAANAVDPLEAWANFSRLTKDAVLVGHNVQFDIDFLHQWLKHLGAKPNWHYHNLDTKSVIWPYFMKTAEIPSVKLDHLCEHFSIQIPGHRALNDCRRVLELLRVVTQHD